MQKHRLYVGMFYMCGIMFFYTFFHHVSNMSRPCEKWSWHVFSTCKKQGIHGNTSWGGVFTPSHRVSGHVYSFLKMWFFAKISFFQNFKNCKKWNFCKFFEKTWFSHRPYNTYPPGAKKWPPKMSFLAFFTFLTNLWKVVISCLHLSPQGYIT